MCHLWQSFVVNLECHEERHCLHCAFACPALACPLVMSLGTFFQGYVTRCSLNKLRDSWSKLVAWRTVRAGLLRVPLPLISQFFSNLFCLHIGALHLRSTRHTDLIRGWFSRGSCLSPLTSIPRGYRSQELEFIVNVSWWEELTATQ